VTDGDLGVAFAVSDLGAMRAGLRIRRVARMYPFLTDDRLAREEEDLLRAQSESELDVTATLLVTAKHLCADLVPERRDPDAFVVLHVDGDDRVHLDRDRLALAPPLDGLLVQSWHWDDYVIVAGLLFDETRRTNGFEPLRLLEWV